MISIITVVFNGAKTIRDTLESVCSQSLLPAEYLIFDGASTDNTLSIINEYAVRFPFIKIISEKDNGIYHAMNKGIAMATGEIVGIINADDWYEQDALKTMYAMYQSNGSGVYYGIQRFLMNDKEFYLERVNHHFLALKMVSHPSAFVTLDIYKQFGNFSEQYNFSADLELFARYLKLGVPFFPMNIIMANFRIGGISSTPEAALESLKIRKRYGLISSRVYYTQSLRKRLKMFFNRNTLISAPRQ